MQRFPEFDKYVVKSLSRKEKYIAEVSRVVASVSRDPNTKVGAVIVDPDYRIVATGYNGFPINIEETDEKWKDRNQKLKYVIHAEENAIIQARADLTGHKIFVWSFFCCSKCTRLIIQAGITEVVSPYPNNPRWYDDNLIALSMFEEASVNIKIY